MMTKKLSLIIAVLLLTPNVLADNLPAYSNISISAAEAGSTVSWSINNAESKKAEKRQEKILAEKTDALNQKLNAKLEENLEKKFNDQLNY